MSKVKNKMRELKKQVKSLAEIDKSITRYFMNEKK